MNRVFWIAMLCLASLLATAPRAQARKKKDEKELPYIGYVYPAGGQQGTMVRVKLGTQELSAIYGAEVSGTGVGAEVVDYYSKLSGHAIGLLREQLGVLEREAGQNATENLDKAKQEILARVESRLAEQCSAPAVAAHSDVVFAEITIAPDAEPGARELRLVTAQGMTNPLPFCVGQMPEFTRKALRTCPRPVVGDEDLALRERPPEEEEERITVPSTLNGQIAPGELNRYRFEAKKGRRLVISVRARQLIPYLADAVPGWFQPVLALHDANGKEVAYNDDFRFKPDPTLYYEVPEDGEYVLSIADALYRGREDFVYRITIGELPFVTSIFPLGSRAGEPVSIAMRGWNLDGAELTPPPKNAPRGVYRIVADRSGFISNSVPFALDTLPECLDREPNDDPSNAQEVKLPIIVNGRVDRPGDWDVFAFEGRAGETIVAEVYARRLDSPLDSMLKITDAAGKLVELNDDHMDVGSGLNTHHADSNLMVELPSDGTYFVHLGDTTRNGGEEVAYRLRLGPPRPDFELRVVPSGGGMDSGGFQEETVYAIRRDGFDGPIKLSLKDPPEGFKSATVSLASNQDSARLSVKTSLKASQGSVRLAIEGRAMIGGEEVAHEAVPADDRIQAFLWRQLVPAQELKVVVHDPSYERPVKRVPPSTSEEQKIKRTEAKSKLSERLVARRLQELKTLYEEGFLTDEFYVQKVVKYGSSG